MAVSWTSGGGVATITITVPLAGLNLGQFTPDQRKEIVAREAVKQIHSAVHTATRTDAQIDAEYDAKVASINAERDQIKASRPSGTI